MRKNRWMVKAMLSVSLASFCSVSLAKVGGREFDERVGMASYYSDKFHGRKTASGELYDKNALTAAHPTLPFGTLIRVENLRNNQSVVVKVNCRLHAANKRLVDLSKRAAKELGMMQSGVAKVRIEVLEIG
jgi:rare lipoprotein A